MDDIECPIFYVVSRSLPIDQASVVLDALFITPVVAAIISDIHDAELALQITQTVIRAANATEAMAMAYEIGQQEAVLVVGDALVLDAYYADGHREVVATC